MAVYKANANGVTHKDLILGGQKHKAVYAGDKLIWEKINDILIITLTWGNVPRDLDSHLIGNNFHVYYKEKTYLSGGEIAVQLDVDDTSSYGPEHTTIYQEIPGGYRFLVHDYTNRTLVSSTALSDSDAEVVITTGKGTLLRKFNVPQASGGTIWDVFEYVNDGRIVPINTMRYGSINNM